jgi:phospholipid/cholesterol/gamma-HCH transport system substrate-binding protein
MPQISEDTRLVADLISIYADASPDLFTGLENAATTARALNDRRADVDAALIGALGFADTGAEIFERAGPYFVRGAADLVPTSKLLDDYRGMIFCTFRNYSEIQQRVAETLGRNGYSLATMSGTFAGAGIRTSTPTTCPG